MKIALHLPLCCCLTLTGCQASTEHSVDFEQLPGRLNVPFGTILEVEGVVLENDAKSKADLDYQWFFAIDTIDERRLDQVVQFGLRSQSDDRINTDTWSVGDRRRLIVYETGGYRGAPAGLFKYYERAYPAEGFHFYHRLVLVAESESDK